MRSIEPTNLNTEATSSTSPKLYMQNVPRSATERKYHHFVLWRTMQTKQHNIKFPVLKHRRWRFSFARSSVTTQAITSFLNRHSYLNETTENTRSLISVNYFHPIGPWRAINPPNCHQPLLVSDLCNSVCRLRFGSILVVCIYQPTAFY